MEIIRGEAIKNYLKNIKDYNGITGSIKFDENGGANIPLTIYTVRDGKFETYM